LRLLEGEGVFIDYLDGSAIADLDTDICIVGGGPAGLSIAYALADSHIDVCLLESGTWTGNRETQALCIGDSIGNIDLDPANARLRAFGGSVRLWGNGCALLTPLDFEARDWVPESGWPFDYDALLPYYERARELFGLESRALGRGNFVGTPKRTPPTFDAPEVINRFTASAAGDPSSLHRARLQRADNIRILLNATVVECVPSANGAAIERVTVQARDGRRSHVRARHVVLACGGIENARLLLLSDSVTPGGLGNGYDQVGRYFMDHPSGRLGRIVGGDLSRVTHPDDCLAVPGGTAVNSLPCLSDDVQRSRRVLNARVRAFPVEAEPAPGVAALRALRARRPSSPANDNLLIERRICEALDHRPATHTSGMTNDPAWRLALRSGLGAADLLHALARKLTDRSTIGPTHVELFGFFEQAPNAASRITLGRELDALGQRRVRVDWRITPLDLHTFHTAGWLFGDAMARVAGGRFEPDEWLHSKSDPTVLHGTAHHIGTTRMADSPHRGVVDRHCRVHGFDNLHVAGSSVFPTGGWAFPTFTIAALSLRLADRLRARLAAERGPVWDRGAGTAIDATGVPGWRT